jgi:hypothetical protein
MVINILLVPGGFQNEIDLILCLHTVWLMKS